jgi:hypothetical protein
MPPGSDPEAKIAALRQEASNVVTQSKSRPEILDVVARQEAEDRSKITDWVMKGFAGALVLVFVLLVLEAAMTGNWAAVVTQAVEILKSVILPIVTLVLGYYFGRASKMG